MSKQLQTQSQSQSLIIPTAKEVISTATDTLNLLHHTIDATFEKVVNHLLTQVQQKNNKIILTGVGKPYFVAQKIAASLSSTGFLAIPLHPVDALHGDMGRISDGDTIFFLSNSGSSIETIEFAKTLNGRNVYKVALTANPNSRLAESCDETLVLPSVIEPGPLNIIPTASILSMLALGDALVIVLAKLNKLTIDSFATNHPAGLIGKSFLNVEALMKPLEEVASINIKASIMDSLHEITLKKTGIVLVIDANNILSGIFTDGDLRRAIASKTDLEKTPIGQIMNKAPQTIAYNAKIADAQKILKDYKINELPVLKENKVVGLLSIKDII